MYISFLFCFIDKWIVMKYSQICSKHMEFLTNSKASPLCLANLCPNASNFCCNSHYSPVPKPEPTSLTLSSEPIHSNVVCKHVCMHVISISFLLITFCSRQYRKIMMNPLVCPSASQIIALHWRYSVPYTSSFKRTFGASGILCCRCQTTFAPDY